MNLEGDGFALRPERLPAADIDALLSTLSSPAVASALEGHGGARDLFALCPAVGDLARSPLIRAIVGPDAFAVRAVLFDKRADANWKVAWHQDRSIAVRARHDVPGYGPWSVKAGIAHVHPPASVLEAMVTLRLHLDDCGAENGPLRVLPGTHQGGRLSPDQVAERVASVEPVVCLAPRGGILAMKPLLLHASSPAVAPAHRRVLHLEFAAAALPEPLVWYETVR